MHNKFYIRFSVSIILILAFVLALPVVTAQDATATPADGSQQTNPIVCESSLTLLVGLAQRDYGYQLPGDILLETGQYQGYFDDSSTMGDDTMEMTPEVGNEEMAEMTPEATAETGSDSGVVLLNPPVVVDENIRCTELRTSVEEFFSSQSRQSNSSGMNGTDNSQSGG